MESYPYIWHIIGGFIAGIGIWYTDPYRHKPTLHTRADLLFILVLGSIAGPLAWAILALAASDAIFTCKGARWKQFWKKKIR